MSADHIAVAKRMYDARNRGDVEAVLAECDPDVEWHPHLATLGGKPILGLAGLREYLASLKQDWEFFHHEPEEFFDLGDKDRRIPPYLRSGQIKRHRHRRTGRPRPHLQEPEGPPLCHLSRSRRGVNGGERGPVTAVRRHLEAAGRRTPGERR